MAILEDFWNPNTWSTEEYEYRVYADDYANVYAVVDQIDYQYLVQWRWKLKKSRLWPGSKKQKAYLARTGHETIGVNCRICATIYLHQVVMDRKGDPRPITNEKIIVDHGDSDEFNCRRNNLRYATLSFNRMNRHGSHEQMLEGL
jgi:hypothetical protein